MSRIDCYLGSSIISFCINSFFFFFLSAAEGFTGGIEKYKTKVVIDNNGTVTWFAATQFISSCKQNIRFFPYDEQFCYLKFG